SALTLMQLDNPGAPVFYSILPGVVNPNNGGYVAGMPEKQLANLVAIQLGHYYDLPVLSGGFGATDAHEPNGWQAGKETSSDPLPISMSGADMGAGIGLLEASTLLYPEKILFDDDIFHTVKTLVQGLDVNQQTLALDEIMEVGPRGHFLTQPSTKDNLRELWQPGITHKWSPEKGDFEDPQKVAKEKIDWILNNHQPEPLDPDVKEEIESIIDKAEKELSSSKI
ncbi:MAG: trimethylamine methyltransferase family protein, partial [Candidatus Bipolaricaulia bacterium]